jgi:hypothetical protein
VSHPPLSLPAVENEIELPEAIGGGSFTMRFVQDVNKHGTHELPDMFYTGVMFGVSNANSHKVEVRCASFLPSSVCSLCDGGIEKRVETTGLLFLSLLSIFSPYAQYSRLQPDRTSKALYEDLLAMKPQPSHVMRR